MIGATALLSRDLLVQTKESSAKGSFISVVLGEAPLKHRLRESVNLLFRY